LKKVLKERTPYMKRLKGEYVHDKTYEGQGSNGSNEAGYA
jgi:hypothetical protein